MIAPQGVERFAWLRTEAGMGRVRGHWSTSKLGKRYWVPTYTRRNPGRAAPSPAAAGRPHGKPTSRSKKIGVAVTLTATITAGGVVATITIPGSSSDVSSVQVSQVGASATSVNVSQAGFRNTESALLAAGYNHIDYAIDFESSCVAHSHGLVETFFKSHPCKWLTRAYLAIHDRNLGEAIVAISWVGMPDAALAEEYKELVDEKGTGNVTELSREVGPYRATNFDSDYYSSGVDGTCVWNMEVQPVGAIPSALASGVFKNSMQ